MRCRTAARFAAVSLGVLRSCPRARVEGAAPTFVDFPAGVLRGFGPIAELRQHRVHITLQRALRRADRRLKPFEQPFGFQLLELAVRVERQRRPREPPRHSRAGGVKPDDEEGGTGEAEREVWIVRVIAYAAVPRVV